MYDKKESEGTKRRHQVRMFATFEYQAADSDRLPFLKVDTVVEGM